MDEKKISAVVVSFNPEYSILSKLISELLLQANQVILVDNSGGSMAYSEFGHHQSFVYDYLGGNQGLGYALNRGVCHALKAGANFIATFDQDSSIPQFFLNNLLSAHLNLRLINVNCAAVGPIFYDIRENTKTYFPFYRLSNRKINIVNNRFLGDYQEVDALITSGMLIDARVFRSSNDYDNQLFVDYTDTEWCFRVRSAGFHLFGCLNVEMGHSPSDAVPARIFGFTFFRYSPLRRYYYFRNTINFCKKKYVPYPWKLRLYSALVLRFIINLFIDPDHLKSFLFMSKGLLHGIFNISGEYRK